MFCLSKDSFIRRVYIGVNQLNEAKIIFFKDSEIHDVAFDSRYNLVASYVDAFHDPWMKQLMNYERRFSKRFKKMFKDFFFGVRDRFPLCCILNFCLDRFLGFHFPKNRRKGNFRNKYGEVYVPCFFCKVRSSR